MPEIWCFRKQTAVNLAAFLSNEVIRIEPTAKLEDADSQPFRKQQIDRTPHRILPGGVGVVIHDHLGDVPGHDCNLLLGQARAARGHHIFDAGLVQAQAVKIALHDHQPPGLLGSLPREMQGVKHIRLRVQRRFGRIQVLRLRVRGESPPAKGNGFSALVPDRKDQTPAEPVVDFAPLIPGKQSTGHWIFEPQITHQPCGGSVSETKSFHIGRLNLPFFQNLPGCKGVFHRQLLLKVRRGTVVNFKKLLSLVVFFVFASGLGRNGHTAFFRNNANGLGKRNLFRKHYK